MALMTEHDGPRESTHDIEMRFLIAQDGPPTPEQLDFQRGLRSEINDVAQKLNAQVVDSREKSLAITHLEEALMWAGKAIFK